jgi:hypothetical protein
MIALITRDLITALGELCVSNSMDIESDPASSQYVLEHFLSQLVSVSMSEDIWRCAVTVPHLLESNDTPPKSAHRFCLYP